MTEESALDNPHSAIERGIMAKTYKQLMEEARQAVPEVTVDEVKNRIERGEKWALLGCT